jgi:hypothetical protein
MLDKFDCKLVMAAWFCLVFSTTNMKVLSLGEKVLFDGLTQVSIKSFEVYIESKNGSEAQDKDTPKIS